MIPEVLQYLKGERVGVVALEMPDGSPHVSAVHFANTEEPLVFVFKTDKKYRKSEPLLEKEMTRASLVVGSNEGDMKTLQLDGEARALGEADAHLIDAYYVKFTDKKRNDADTNALYFSFTPTWWRFTDWTLPEGKTIFTKDGKQAAG